MPDFSKCVQDKNGDIWWFQMGVVYKVKIEQPDPTTIPPEVWLKLLDKSTGWK
jgi:hypothetical protein